MVLQTIGSNSLQAKLSHNQLLMTVTQADVELGSSYEAHWGAQSLCVDTPVDMQGCLLSHTT